MQMNQIESTTNKATSEDLEAHVLSIMNLQNLIATVKADKQDMLLLNDALNQLQLPFLIAVAGRHNSGKSTLINALLGEVHTETGQTYETPEITAYRHISQKGGVEIKYAKIVKHLDHNLMKIINFLDTPGTSTTVSYN
jgi:ribosome biogenesis GTPase A